MPRNGSGTYTLPSGNPTIPGTVISSSGWWNPTGSDLASAITQSLASDGQTVPVANLPMGNFRHVNVANALNRNEYATYGQVQDGQPQWMTVTGTDTILGTIAPGPTGYVAGQAFRFVAAGANTTTAVTLNINSLGAKSITKNGATALAAGDIPAGSVVNVVYDGTQFQFIGVSFPNAAIGNSPFGFRNKLINAKGTINQRAYVSGTATTIANQYTLDMWKVVVSGQSLSFVTSGNAVNMTAPAGGVEQVIEGTNIEGGNYFLNWTGTATATVNGSAVTKGVAFSLPSNTNATIRFIGGTFLKPQLEIGGVTPFDDRSIGFETAECTRHLQVLSSAGSGDIFANGQCISTTQAIVFVPLLNGPMRVAPSISITAASDFSLLNSTGSNVSVIGISTQGSSATHISLLISVASGIAAGNATMLSANNSNAKLFLNSAL